MSNQTQHNDLVGAGDAEFVRGIISEQIFSARCVATPAEESGFVNCALPNAMIEIAGLSQPKRIKQQIANVPIGFLNGADITFDSVTGIVICSNFPTIDINLETIADLSCVNLTGGKCLFIPAFLEGELARVVSQGASERYNITAPTLRFGSSTVDLINTEYDQYGTLDTFFQAIRDNIGTASSVPGPGAAIIAAAATAALAELTIQRNAINTVRVT